MPGGKVPAPIVKQIEKNALGSSSPEPEIFTPDNFSPQKLRKLFFKKDKEAARKNSSL